MDVPLGIKTIKYTAHSHIGKVSYCTPQSVAFSFVDGTPTAPSKRPTYVVLGFSYERNDDVRSTELEGILERQVEGSVGKTQTGVGSIVTDTQGRVVVETVGKTTWFLYLKDHGMKITGSPSSQDSGLYYFRIKEPLNFVLGGFILATNPLRVADFHEFIYSPRVPVGKAVYIGSFHLSKTAPKEPQDTKYHYSLLGWTRHGSFAVTTHTDSALLEWLKSNVKEIMGREIVVSPWVDKTIPVSTR